MSDAIDPSPTRQRSPLRTLIAFSLAVTLTAGLVALAIYALTSTRFLLAFVLLRWTVVFALVAVPAIAWLWPRLPIPGVLRSPLTPLLLTCESIIVDIISAQLH